LFNASLFARAPASLDGLSVCEGLGFESGVNRRFREAPIFYGCSRLLIVIGAPCDVRDFAGEDDSVLTGDQTGVASRVVLIFMTLLINKKKLMHAWDQLALYTTLFLGGRALMVG